MTKPKLAIICSTDYKTYPMGGMMSFIIDLLPHLSKDFEITLMGVDTDSKKNNNHFIELSGREYPLKIFSGVKTGKRIIPNIVRVVYNIWKSTKKILQEDYDIIYFHGIPLSFPVLRKHTKNGGFPKIVNHVHGLTNPFAFFGKKSLKHYLLASLYEKYRNWVVKKSELILLASDQDGHKNFSNNYPHEISCHIKYVPNFADNTLFKYRDKEETRQLLKIESSAKIFVSAGRLSPQKDPVLLIEAFALLKANEKKDRHLYIIGDGELSQQLSDLVEEKKLSKCVHFLGRLDRTEIALWLSASDVYVYTSHGNGFPIALVEASMCGLPVVTTDVTGVHDIVIHEETGYLINNREPKTIALYMSTALKQHQILAKNILLQSKQFTPDRIAKNISKMLQSTTGDTE